MSRRIVPLLLALGFVTGTSWAASDPFVGRWKLDPSRSQLTDEMKVAKVGRNKYVFDFGGGKTETIVVDGTDQPGIGGTTLSVAAEGPNWKVIRKQGGRVVIEATWTLSKDDSSLFDDFTSFGQDGSPTNIKYVYKRTAGGRAGFAGSWVSTSEAVGSAFSIRIAPYDNGDLSLTTPSGKTRVRFDGKSARRLSPSTVERFVKSEGRMAQTQHFELSSDLKTLTLTTRTVGRSAPNIYVFERQ